MSSQPENLNNFNRYLSDNSLTRAAQQRLLALQAQRKSQIEAANLSLQNYLAVDQSIKPRSKSVPTTTKIIRFSSPKPYDSQESIIQPVNDTLTQDFIQDFSCSTPSFPSSTQPTFQADSQLQEDTFSSSDRLSFHSDIFLPSLLLQTSDNDDSEINRRRRLTDDEEILPADEGLQTFSQADNLLLGSPLQSSQRTSLSDDDTFFDPSQTSQVQQEDNDGDRLNVQPDQPEEDDSLSIIDPPVEADASINADDASDEHSSTSADPHTDTSSEHSDSDSDDSSSTISSDSSSSLLLTMAAASVVPTFGGMSHECAKHFLNCLICMHCHKRK